MLHRLKIEGENPTDALSRWKKIPPRKDFLKKRTKLVCCGRKNPDNDRIKYGTSRCDSYALSHRLAIIIANSLYQYVSDAEPRIVRDDWEKIKKCADTIRDFANADSWDSTGKFKKQEKDFRDAMKWVVENWNSFWW